MKELFGVLERAHFWLWPPLAGLIVFSLLLVSGVHANETWGRQMTGSAASYVLFATLITFGKELFQVRHIIKHGCPQNKFDERNLIPPWAAWLFAGLHFAAVVGLIVYWIFCCVV